MIWNNIKAIIFDFDDTLIHSGRSVIEAIYATAEKMKLPKPSEEAIIRLRGIPLFETVQALWPFADTERAVETYLRVYSDDKVTLIDGVNETLLKLKNNGLELHILTSKGKATLHRHISHTRLQAGLFTSIIGADMIEYHKPDGRVFNTLLQDNSPIGLIFINPLFLKIVGSL